MLSSIAQPASRAGGAASAQEASNAQVLERRIGDLMRVPCQLTDKQVEWILNYQRENDLRFGESAIELGLARREDVLWALSQQFHYPYAIDEKQVNPELVIAASPFSDEAEAFRELRSQLLMGVMAPDKPRRAIAVVSPDVGDGKTYLASNTAAAFSQLGGPTLFIDADMRTPRSQDVFGITLNRSGLVRDAQRPHRRWADPALVAVAEPVRAAGGCDSPEPARTHSKAGVCAADQGNGRQVRSRHR